jgi:hypothetical protein
MWGRVAKLGALTGVPHDVVDGLEGKLRLVLGDEQARKLVLPGGEATLDCAQLVDRDRARRRASPCAPPKGGFQLSSAHSNGFGDAQTVPIDHFARVGSNYLARWIIVVPVVSG